jgi:hypothetical protein
MNLLLTYPLLIIYGKVSAQNSMAKLASTGSANDICPTLSLSKGACRRELVEGSLSKGACRKALLSYLIERICGKYVILL